MCGGEPLSKSLAKDLVLKSDQLWNMYGPTEATVWSSCELIDKDFDKITVGKALLNYEYFILDENLQEIAHGEKGKLYIAGDSVTLGYLGREELTNEKFIMRNNLRLYDTGDIARFNEDFKVELFGRSDYQVKIRGYRIELGEIEERIKELPEIAECVVKVFSLSEDDKRMVAFLHAEIRNICERNKISFTR